MGIPVEKQAPEPEIREIQGGVAAARGYRAAGLHAGIKRQRYDLALVASETPAVAAATYTTNLVQAACVHITRQHLQDGRGQAIVCNSGIANACNGPQGLADARQMAEITAAALGIASSDVAVGSTGVIGQLLPMDKVVPGIRRVAKLLSPEGSHAAAQGIMTTDTRPKEIAVEVDVGGEPVRLGGIAKGSGMIHPNMATMLAFVTTDCAIAQPVVQEAVRRSVRHTYNMISVDGDTSTNDMVICLANGMADNAPITGDGADLDAFQAALDYVNRELAKAIARDGEGATKLIEITVTNAPSWEDARLVARSVATSSLVKTAVYGEDANWGRIHCAAGYSGARFDPDQVDIYIGDLQVAHNGMAVDFDEQQASEILREQDVNILLDLKAGMDTATMWTCDMTYDYVKINASYRS